MKQKNILNIYIDETGDNHFGKGGSAIYGFSFIFHESKNDISNELDKLEYKLSFLNFTGMIHISELIMNSKKYACMSISERKKIFYALFYFYELSLIKSKSFFVQKKDAVDKDHLNIKLTSLLNEFINENYEYLTSFDEIVIFYDKGQYVLYKMFEESFSVLKNSRINSKFDKETERLFQVADMITFLDKIRFKVKYKIAFNSGEKYYFTPEEIKKIIKKLEDKEFKAKH